VQFRVTSNIYPTVSDFESISNLTVGPPTARHFLCTTYAIARNKPEFSTVQETCTRKKTRARKHVRHARFLCKSTWVCVKVITTQECNISQQLVLTADWGFLERQLLDMWLSTLMIWCNLPDKTRYTDSDLSYTNLATRTDVYYKYSFFPEKYMTEISSILCAG